MKELWEMTVEEVYEQENPPVVYEHGYDPFTEYTIKEAEPVREKHRSKKYREYDEVKKYINAGCGIDSLKKIFLRTPGWIVEKIYSDITGWVKFTETEHSPKDYPVSNNKNNRKYKKKKKKWPGGRKPGSSRTS